MSSWKILDSTTLFQNKVFKLRVDRCEMPDGRIVPRYYVLEFPDWVNVVPITRDGKMVMIRQYRHGAAADFLEIPGGSTDPGSDKDPRAAGERELLEETGYSAEEWVNCGAHYPNPALQSNRMHTFLALGCAKVSDPKLDPFEDLTVELVDVRQALRDWQNGAVKHSLISASIALCWNALAERGYSI